MTRASRIYPRLNFQEGLRKDLKSVTSHDLKMISKTALLNIWIQFCRVHSTKFKIRKSIIQNRSFVVRIPDIRKLENNRDIIVLLCLGPYTRYRAL